MAPNGRQLLNARPRAHTILPTAADRGEFLTAGLRRAEKGKREKNSCGDEKIAPLPPEASADGGRGGSVINLREGFQTATFSLSLSLSLSSHHVNRVDANCEEKAKPERRVKLIKRGGEFIGRMRAGSAAGGPGAPSNVTS